MKKILIALPLVLIMILSMVPVFAEDTVDVTINGIKYLDNPKNGNEIKTIETYTIKGVKATDASDAEKLEKLIKENIKANFTEPTLKSKESFGWEYDVENLQVLVDKKAEVFLQEQTLAKASDLTALKNAIASYIDLDISGVTATEFANDALITKINDEAKKQVGEEQITVVKMAVKAEDTTKTAPAADRKLNVPTLSVAEHKDASASVVVYPDRVIKKPEEKKETCLKTCDQITFVAFDLSTNKLNKDLSVVYETNSNQIPEISAAIEHYYDFLAKNNYQIVSKFDLTPAIWSQVALEDCVVEIHVVPMMLKVDVFHQLYACCKKSDGKLYTNPYPEKIFREEDVTVPFIEFSIERVINQVKAEEWAKTRIQKVTNGEWVFDSAIFIDPLNLGKYITGRVFDMDGNMIADGIVRGFEGRAIERPTIIIKYKAAVCVEETEEQVDNATVENNNNSTTTPVTANGGANLPATGAKDVSAFFLSAVALLGLGIFFAKKH